MYPGGTTSPPNVQQMWQSLRKETWIHPGAAGNKELHLDRGVERSINDSIAKHPQRKPQPKTAPRRKRQRTEADKFFIHDIFAFMQEESGRIFISI
jgi:hypothetical protein